MHDNSWFMTLDVDRAGRTVAWRYPLGATERDLEYMGRVTDVLPRLVEADTERIYLEPKTVEIERGWFE